MNYELSINGLLYKSIDEQIKFLTVLKVDCFIDMHESTML